MRFPTLRPLSAPLDSVARALEMLLHQPVTASAFWSRGRLSAPGHYDEHDILAVQLRGTKTWRLARGPSPLCTPWKRIPGAPPALGKGPVVATVMSGDILYLPRGLPHTVDADGESIHVALGFTPLTLRDAVVAALDELTEEERALRGTLIGDLDAAHEQSTLERTRDRVAEAIAALHHAAGASGFLDQALRRRSARAVGALAAADLFAKPAIHSDTLSRRRPLVFCHVSASADMIDVAYPGGHLYVHRGAGGAWHS
ncbi:JmjC domain-containing protein [Sphingomonas sp.]|uniref:JmjC domain-containing protein n=1 Tax=Sphingomonas sp. TaxID=28214 RepID=UPI003B0041A4